MTTLALTLGFGAALFYTPLVAMVGDIAPSGLEGTLIGSYRFFRDMGYSAGPIILGIIADAYGIQYSFYITSLILLVTTIIVYATSRETIVASVQEAKD